MKTLYLSLLNVFLILFSVNAQDVPQIERDALMALYNATEGDSWDVNTNWGSSELVSNWSGVTVENDQVTEIHLYYNNLSGSIPIEIGNFPELTELWESVQKELSNQQEDLNQ